MTILAPSGLETADYNLPGWQAIYNTNMERLNNALLKVQALQDVNTATLNNGDVLRWDASANKWTPGVP